MSSTLIQLLIIMGWFSPPPSSVSPGVSGLSVCPSVALDLGLELLCGLLQSWGQVPAGVLALTEWLLGDEESSEEGDADDPPTLVRPLSLHLSTQTAPDLQHLLRSPDLLTFPLFSTRLKKTSCLRRVI